MKTKSACMAFLCLIITGCLINSNDEKSKEITNSTYFQYDAKFSVALPPGWTSKLDQKVGELKLDMTSAAPPIENFSANVVVIISKHGGINDIAAVINLIKSNAQQSTPGVEFLSDTVLVKSGVPLGKLVYRGNILGKKFKFMQLVFVRNNLDVQLEFTDLEKFFDGRQEFVDIENSLAFLP